MKTRTKQRRVKEASEYFNTLPTELKKGVVRKILSDNKDLIKRKYKDSFTAEDMLAISKNAGLSGRKAKIILKDLRLTFGREICDPYIRNALAEKKKTFHDILKINLKIILSVKVRRN